MVTLIDLNTEKYLCTAAKFNNISKILFTDNAELIIAFTKDELLLLDTAKLSLISKKTTSYSIGNPACVWTKKGLIHVVYLYNMESNGKTYYGIEYVYSIDENNKFSIVEINNMSSFKMTADTPPIIYKPLNSSGLVIFKTIEHCDDLYISKDVLEYSTDEEFPFRMLYDTIEDNKNISDWNLAQLHTEDGIWKHPKENDLTIITPNFKPCDNMLICKNNTYYVYEQPTKSFVELDSEFFKTKKILYYCEQENAIYYILDDYVTIHKYLIDSEQTITSSPRFEVYIYYKLK